MSIIVNLVILGLVFYFIQIPMAEPFAKIIKVVAIILAVVVVLQWLGIATGLPTVGLR